MRHGICQVSSPSLTAPSASACVTAASSATGSLSSQRVRWAAGNSTPQKSSNPRTIGSMLPSSREAAKQPVTTRVNGLSGHAYGC